MPQPTESRSPGSAFAGQEAPQHVPFSSPTGAPFPTVVLSDDRRRNEEWRRTLIRRVRREFLEMPGMHLTLTQACRLFGLRADICERILRGLVDEEFLWVAHDGAFSRRAT